MTNRVLKKEFVPKSVLNIIIRFILVMVSAAVFSLLLHNTWVNQLDISHSILEILCMFICLTIFLSLWYTYEHHDTQYYAIGFGYLLVAIFDGLHTLYFLGWDITSANLSSYFWIAARLAASIALLLLTIKLKKVGKWTALVISLSLCAVVSYTLINFNKALPTLVNSNGLTPIKIILEIVIIAIYVVSLLRIWKIDLQQKMLEHNHIIMAILLNISSGIIFTLFSSVTSMLWTIGHIIKIISYYFLFHGTFISSIIYPYEKLAQKHQLLEEKNEKLKREQKRLIQQERLALLGQLGAGIVHETRNYLTTIKGSNQLISYLTNEKRIKSYTDVIDQNIEEMNKILSEFLFLSKPKELQLNKTPLNRLITDLKSILSSGSAIKGINIEYNLSKEDLLIMCDESQLKQVILNLYRNAVDAVIDNQDARIVIETGLDKAQNKVYIRISDNGKGISKENLNKIGTPFFTTKQNGTGLGLSVCYSIIDNHNGQICVDSALNKGTKFTIYLPLVNSENTVVIANM